MIAMRNTFARIAKIKLFRLSLFAALRKIRADQRGNVLMIMGFALMPLVFATGMAIDYSRAARLQTKLNAAADAASLSAVTKPMLDQSIQDACNAARQTFLNSFQQYSTGLTFNATTDLKISVTETYSTGADVTLSCPASLASVPGSFTKPASRVVTVTYTGKSTNAFGGILGQSTIDIGGNASARAGLGGYYQIVFLVDVSSSMSIGGTAAETAKMVADPTIKCSFACHNPKFKVFRIAATNWCDANPQDYFCHAAGPMYCPYGKGNCSTVDPSLTYTDTRGLAKMYGYKLKIDYVIDAMNSFMTKLKPTMDAKPNNYNVGVYTFGSTFQEIQSLTNNSTTVQSAINKVDVEVADEYVTNDGNPGYTFTSVGLQSTLSKLTNIGDGSSPTKRRTYVIFLSDGVEDTPGDIIWNRGTFYNYLAQCQAIKNANITLFSIEAAYPALAENDDSYKKLIAELPSRNNGLQIPDAMKNCASSPDRYFMASDGPAIQDAVEKVFVSINSDTSRLTN